MTVRCIECPTNPHSPAQFVDAGVAGASAYREYERRTAAREARVKAVLGTTLGAIALAASGEARSTAAWKRGSIGESKLARTLAEVIGVQVLNDRRVRGSRANIDHIVIAPAGVFVVDAKLYKGLIRVRDRGTWFTRDDRLYVGRRDCSRLADNMVWQVDAVRRFLTSAGPPFADVRVEPVLCFVDGEWSLTTPQSYRGVRLEGLRSIKKLVIQSQLVDAQQIGRISQLLAIAFPSK
jgi:hypothetical protein